jgi:2-polyprenyl-3-methyl-5-hydroxy-6-metoxy-1,4-benzoquinol methylase
MDDSMKLHWKMRYEWYPNDKYLKSFDDLVSAYLLQKSGRILDIGCGQSPFILDMLESKFELYAQDEECLQISYLQQRIRDQGYPLERVNYSTSRFPNTEFTGKFEGVVISNILHFYSLEEIQTSLLPTLFALLKPGSILIVTVHSTKHPSSKLSITKESYFQHFFNHTDLNLLFPKDRFYTLYYLTKSVHSRIYENEFLKAWIKQFHHDNDVFDQRTIQKAQKDYLKESRQDSITVVYKMKDSK